MVSGSLADFFRSLRELRQGDSLSPMGFIIIINFIFFMMEIFRKMSKQVKGDGLLRGFRSDGRWDGGECVLHLLFVNDTILFYDADPTCLDATTLFQAVTGLKVNVLKSETVLIGEVNNVHALVEILGCRIETLPMSYLGMPLGASHKSSTIWNPILEKIEWKLAV